MRLKRILFLNKAALYFMKIIYLSISPYDVRRAINKNTAFLIRGLYMKESMGKHLEIR